MIFHVNSNDSYEKSLKTTLEYENCGYRYPRRQAITAILMYIPLRACWK